MTDQRWSQLEELRESMVEAARGQSPADSLLAFAARLGSILAEGPAVDARLDDLAKEIHERGCTKGFWDRAKIELPDDPTEPRFAPPKRVDNPSVIPEKLALVHSEVSEALDALRDDDQDHFAEELADVLIRTLDIAAFCGLSIDEALTDKMAKNLSRPPLNGRSW